MKALWNEIKTSLNFFAKRDAARDLDKRRMLYEYASGMSTLALHRALVDKKTAYHDLVAACVDIRKYERTQKKDAEPVVNDPFLQDDIVQAVDFFLKDVPDETMLVKSLCIIADVAPKAITAFYKNAEKFCWVDVHDLQEVVKRTTPEMIPEPIQSNGGNYYVGTPLPNPSDDDTLDQVIPLGRKRVLQENAAEILFFVSGVERTHKEVGKYLAQDYKGRNEEFRTGMHGFIRQACRTLQPKQEIA